MEKYLAENNLMFLFAVLCLTIIILRVIKYLVTDYSRNKRFYTYIEENSYDPGMEETDDQGNPKYEIYVFDRSGDPNTPMVIPYKINHPYFINRWDVIFGVIFDKDKNRILLVDKNDEEGIVKYPFNSSKFEDGILISEVSFKGRSTELSIHLVPAGSSMPRP